MSDKGSKIRTLGFDTETYVSPPSPAAPRMVCGSFYDGDTPPVLVLPDETRDRVYAALRDRNTTIVGHNLVYDLSVVCAWDPRLIPWVFTALEEDRLRCTMIRQRLINNAKGCLDYDYRGRPQRYGLDALVKYHLDLDISADKKSPDAWRMRYHELDGVAIDDYPTAAYEYALYDAVYAWECYFRQHRETAAYIARDDDRVDGITNEREQLRLAWALKLSSCWGLRTKEEYIKWLRTRLLGKIGDVKRVMVREGIMRPDGSKIMSVIRDRVRAAYEKDDRPVGLTDGGKSGNKKEKTDKDTLLNSRDPILIRLGETSAPTHHLRNFVPALMRGRYYALSPSYSVVKATGRVSSYNPINIQNVPKYGGFRECFQARDGTWLLACDYCLVAGTPIVTSEGIMPIEQVAAELPGVLSSVDGKTLSFEKVEKGAPIGVAPTVWLELEDGSKVRCTLDHKWMTYDGRLVKTRNLSVGDRLAHVKTSYAGPQKYPTWYLRSNRNYKYKHRLVAEYNLGPAPEGYEVDHIDGDVNNWRSDNLRHLPEAENRGQAAGRWWAKASSKQRKDKLESLIQGTRENRRSYKGEGNPNHGKRSGCDVACLSCGNTFYQYPSTSKKYCSRGCYLSEVSGNNHKVKAIVPAEPARVYQITVANTHTYVLENGLVSGNSQLELCTLAQVCLKVIGYSAMAEAINAGKDLHLVLAARMLGVPYGEVSKATHGKIRQFCKIGNYGFGGGMGVATMLTNLFKNGYTDKTEADSMALRDAWLTTWPACKDYLDWIGGRVNTGNGFTDVVQVRSGRRRAKCSYCQAANTYFQGLAADGMALACYRVIRECYLDTSSVLYGQRMVANVHDEILMEVDQDIAHACGVRLDAIMVEAMRVYVPDVRIECEWALQKRWSKGSSLYLQDGVARPFEESPSFKGYPLDADGIEYLQP